MAEWQRCETEWEGLRLVVERDAEKFQLFVYDPAECEVLYTAARMNLDAAQIAAVEYAATTRFGASNDLNPQVIVAMLVWESKQ